MTRVRRIIGAALATTLVLSAQAALFACPICFQFESGPVTKGITAAILVLVGVTVSVLAGFGAFVVRFARREPLFEDPPNP